MRAIDWGVFAAALTAIVSYGLWRARRAQTMAQFLVGGRTLPWHVVGLSIMATQASAVTFISTTGQGFVDGMRFVQFYFGLPIAMLILGVTAVPLFQRAKVYTAYEYLERRFDGRTRSLVSGIFLLQRGLALGITLYAPAVVLSVILGWPDWMTTILMGTIAVTYTTVGGVKAIAWSDTLQMGIMTLGLIAALASAVALLPDHVSMRDAVDLADLAQRMNVITTAVDWNDRYNLWSGLIGGTFLALAYFGTDQSQVQRYLSGRSVSESRRGLWLNAVAKIPMQLFILFIGVMVYVFYVYERPPLLFQPSELGLIATEARAADYRPIAGRHDAAFDARRQAADEWLDARQLGDIPRETAAGDAYRTAQSELSAARRDASALAVRSGGTGGADTNFIFLTFVTRYLPAGVVGLVIAVIFGATMAAIAAEMSALATVSVVDIYKRHRRREASDHYDLVVSRIAMVFWGLYAVVCAQYVKGLGSLVEVVNVLGSLFYGGMLGIFVLAFFFSQVHARAAFLAVLVGESVIFACWYFTDLAFLWYNVIGCVAVVVSGVLLAKIIPNAPPRGVVVAP